jgi:hypothetical protein
MSHLEDRTLRYTKIVEKDNLEFDYLDKTSIDFSTFPTPELIYIVTQTVIGRIDLVSFQSYGTVDLWWLIALRNDIINPIDDLVLGDQLYIPSLSDYYDWYNKNIKIQDDPDFIATPRTL